MRFQLCSAGGEAKQSNADVLPAAAVRWQASRAVEGKSSREGNVFNVQSDLRVTLHCKPGRWEAGRRMQLHYWIPKKIAILLHVQGSHSFVLCVCSRCLKSMGMASYEGQKAEKKASSGHS